jgi:uracil-DNA glycosylase
MGYRGGRFSGIAFTAERSLLEWGAPFRPTSTRTGGWAEPSGTIVHGALAEAGAEDLAILWNSVPAHPHRPGAPLTNRAPTRTEIEAGAPLLDAAIALLRPQRIVAVGRTAERSLGDRAEACVRHPAQGGATQFREGIARLLG